MAGIHFRKQFPAGFLSVIFFPEKSSPMSFSQTKMYVEAQQEYLITNMEGMGAPELG